MILRNDNPLHRSHVFCMSAGELPQRMSPPLPSAISSTIVGASAVSGALLPRVSGTNHDPTEGDAWNHHLANPSNTATINRFGSRKSGGLVSSTHRMYFALKDSRSSTIKYWFQLTIGYERSQPKPAIFCGLSRFQQLGIVIITSSIVPHVFTAGLFLD